MEEVFGTLKMNDYASLMSTMDADGNGKVDYDEFLTAAIDKHSILNNENLQKAFSMFDTDNSGQISMDELRDAFDSHQMKEVELFTEIMDEVDKDRDQYISMQEFMDSMTILLKKKHSRKLF